MHASAASCRRATRGTTWTLPWAPSDGSGQSWDSSSLQVLSRVRGLNRRAIAFSGRIPYFGGRFLTIEESSHARSEEHTSELQSHSDLVCRLLLEKKK